MIIYTFITYIYFIYYSSLFYNYNSCCDCRHIKTTLTVIYTHINCFNIYSRECVKNRQRKNTQESIVIVFKIEEFSNAWRTGVRNYIFAIV